MKLLSPEELNKPRTRRLRKKLRVREFQELGCELEFEFLPELGLTFDEALEEWIEFVESKDWVFGGGGSVRGTTIEGFVARAGRGTLKEEDRLLAEQWLSERKWVKSFHVGSLKDAWHGW
jgi:uncharacterized protein YggL (DUF469 family)